MISRDAAGYLVAAGSFAALAVLLATRWRSRMRGSFLLPAAVASVAWGLVNSAQPGDSDAVGLVAEVLWQLAWIAFLLQAFGGPRSEGLTPVLRVGPWGVAAAALVVGGWLAATGRLTTATHVAGTATTVTGLALGLIGVVLVEQALRNTRAAHSWEVKFLWLGAGAIFAYEVALYSASYALGALADGLYAARGYAMAAVVPLLAVGVGRVRGFEPRVFMSQTLAFYASSVVIAGVCLVGIGTAAYYVRVFGGNWGGVLQTLVVFVTLLGLTALALSRGARARLRVVLAKHWFPYKYDYRSEWLGLTAGLTTGNGESSLAQRTVEAFVGLARVTSGAVLVRREGALHLTAGICFDVREPPVEPVDGEFCRFLEAREWILNLDHARARLGPDADVAIPAWLAAIPAAWLVVPLVHDRRLEALVVLQRAGSSAPLTWEDLDLLRTAARQAASYFALDAAADALAREKQFAALNRFTAYLMHDLSNIVAQQRMLIENAARHKTNPAFVDDALATIESTVQRLTRLLDELKTGSAELPPARTVQLADLCRGAVARAGSRAPQPRLETSAVDAAITVPGERLEHVLEHLIRNAQDATPAEGAVTVTVRAEPEAAVIDITDTGCGMTAEFIRDRLFRPFDTTKGAKGMGIGAFQAREFARLCGGDLTVRSAPGSGTSVVLRFPLASRATHG